MWPGISYETSLNQSPFDVPKIKTKTGPKFETPCEQPSSNNDEETISLAIKRFLNFFLGCRVKCFSLTVFAICLLSVLLFNFLYLIIDI